MVEHKHIIFFDGICNLCNGAVNFVINKDKNNVFKFASLQSVMGQEILKSMNLPLCNYNSFIYISEGIIYTKSTAALHVIKKLPGLISLLYIFIIVPKILRDGVYTTISKYRYAIWGKSSECLIPGKDIKAKFLSE